MHFAENKNTLTLQGKKYNIHRSSGNDLNTILCKFVKKMHKYYEKQNKI